MIIILCNMEEGECTISYVIDILMCFLFYHITLTGQSTLPGDFMWIILAAGHCFYANSPILHYVFRLFVFGVCAVFLIIWYIRYILAFVLCSSHFCKGFVFKLKKQKLDLPLTEERNRILCVLTHSLLFSQGLCILLITGLVCCYVYTHLFIAPSVCSD